MSMLIHLVAVRFFGRSAGQVYVLVWTAFSLRVPPAAFSPILISSFSNQFFKTLKNPTSTLCRSLPRIHPLSAAALNRSMLEKDPSSYISEQWYKYSFDRYSLAETTHPIIWSSLIK
uniref:Uncharacterized protein n=1 Tax=Helianthus annuus TaxID=4232 RepID=A0A251UMC8_HELAN